MQVKIKDNRIFSSQLCMFSTSQMPLEKISPSDVIFHPPKWLGSCLFTLLMKMSYWKNGNPISQYLQSELALVQLAAHNTALIAAQ